jgi:hypothetical protein
MRRRTEPRSHCARLRNYRRETLLHSIEAPIAARMPSVPLDSSPHSRLRERVQVCEIKVARLGHLLAIMPGSNRNGPHPCRLAGACAARLAEKASLHSLLHRSPGSAKRLLGSTLARLGTTEPLPSNHTSLQASLMQVQHDCAARRLVTCAAAPRQRSVLASQFDK